MQPDTRNILRPILFISILIGFPAFSQNFTSGYHVKIAGEDLEYHSPQPDAGTSLLVRSEDSTRYIEWVARTPSKGYNPPRVPYLLLAGIDVNPQDPHSWKVFVNDRHLFTISSPLDTLDKELEWNGPEGSKLVFKVSEVDKYGDFMGYMSMYLPEKMLQEQVPVRIKVTGESAGSRTWFMVFRYETKNAVRLTAENAVERTEQGNRQLLRTTILHYGEPVDALIRVAGQDFRRTIGFGYQSLGIPVPEIRNDTVIPVKITAGTRVLCDTIFTLRPVPHRTICLLHHSHNDIGYTHVQDEVEMMQWKNLEDAIRLAKETQDYPEGSRFRWNTEVMWALASYLNQATPAEKNEFMEAVRNGWIELHGLYGNELVSLCESEELLWLMEPARRVAGECVVPLTSAMITDIPGWSWGLVPALSLSGVKYLSLGTNSGHRIGGTIKEWGDRPFYWVSPSGEEKVLCWIHGKGYSFFHTGLDYKKIRKRLQEDLILDYMNELADQDYPYDIVMLRYTIGSDNGPVDEYLPESVKAWNEKYVTPKIQISTVGEAFRQFEEKYGESLPEISGDFTAYWEDGAYSTARETILNRASAARLNQAQILRSIMDEDNYPEEDFRKAWMNVLLFDEHTWGSWNSISEPESDFTQSQWKIKADFARKAHDQSSRLFQESMPEVLPEDFPLQAFEVINTCSWYRSGLVGLPVDVLPLMPVIRDPGGNIVPVQVTGDGQLVFLVRDVPPLGSLRFSAETGKKLFRLPDEGAPVPVLSNQDFELRIDETTGAIRQLTWRETGLNLADAHTWAGLNLFLYVEGRNPADPATTDKIRIMKGEEGPVVNSLRILSRPPGCRIMETEIELINGLEEIYITNHIDKNAVYEPEGVHLAFPFDIPGGIMRYDLAFAQCEVEKDQIKGSNRNFLTLENWIDISNEEFGVTIACPDAPLFEVGEITMDEIVTGWREKLAPSQTFFSYIMNNYWETNFAAAQEGNVSFTYVIKPHRQFDALEAERFGMENRYPLVIIPSGKTPKGKSEPAGLQNLSPGIFSDVILVSLKPVEDRKGYLACLYNPSDEPAMVELVQKGKIFYRTGIDGNTKNEIVEKMEFPAKSIRFLLIVNK